MTEHEEATEEAVTKGDVTQDEDEALVVVINIGRWSAGSSVANTGSFGVFTSVRRR
jgi:hypothetical protein